MNLIKAIGAFNDNYIWALCHPEQPICAVVDPGDAAPVLDFLRREGRQLTAVLVTHHHGDHTGGIRRLVSDAPLCDDFAVYGPGSIDQVTHPVSEGDRVSLPAFALHFEVMAVPGHTLDHLAYTAPGILFCGDTLFSGGCGRLFEGTASQLHRSLTSLAKLPPETAVYCAHEYTLANLAFAETVEPNNRDLSDYRRWCEAQRNQHLPTLPSSIARELQINPFLRVDQSAVQQAVAEQFGQSPKPAEQTLGFLRRWKDLY